jgi:hypothetical protein
MSSKEVTLQEFEVQGIWFDYLYDGSKTWEGRADSSRMVKETQIGQEIIIFRIRNGMKSWFRMKILGKRDYLDTEKMITDLGCPLGTILDLHNNILPGCPNVLAGINIYKKFGITGPCVAINLIRTSEMLLEQG